MRKLQLLAMAAGVLLLFTGPNLAAKRGQQPDVRGQATSTQTAGQNRADWRSSYGAVSGQNRPQNLPYADRPYGDPGRW